MDEVERCITEEIPEWRRYLLQSHSDLSKVAQHCRDTYKQATEPEAKDPVEGGGAAINQTQQYAVQSLTSVAYYVNMLSTSFLTLLDHQKLQLDELGASVNHLKENIDIHKEQVARQEIGQIVLPVNLNRPRVSARTPHYVPPPVDTEKKKYARRAIDYSQFDHIGHAVRLQEDMQLHSGGDSDGKPSSAGSSDVGSTGSLRASHGQDPLGLYGTLSRRYMRGSHLAPAAVPAADYATLQSTRLTPPTYLTLPMPPRAPSQSGSVGMPVGPGGDAGDRTPTNSHPRGNFLISGPSDLPPPPTSVLNTHYSTSNRFSLASNQSDLPDMPPEMGQSFHEAQRYPPPEPPTWAVPAVTTEQIKRATCDDSPTTPRSVQPEFFIYSAAVDGASSSPSTSVSGGSSGTKSLKMPSKPPPPAPQPKTPTPRPLTLPKPPTLYEAPIPQHSSLPEPSPELLQKTDILREPPSELRFKPDISPRPEVSPKPNILRMMSDRTDERPPTGRWSLTRSLSSPRGDLTTPLGDEEEVAHQGESSVGSAEDEPARFRPPQFAEKVVAVYVYEAQRPDELSLHENEVVYVVKKNDDGWYEGVSEQGARGVFPSNYVQRLL